MLVSAVLVLVLIAPYGISLVLDPFLVRVYKGEVSSRPPVWLMRQAGRYMADFRKIAQKYTFRQRSETPDIAVELSLQPWKRFGVDGVIMFSGM